MKKLELSALRILMTLTEVQRYLCRLAARIESGGYGTDAVNTLVGFMFNHLNIHRVYVNVFESNVRAIRSYEKSGFLIEGTLREAHFANGKYENTVVMGLLSSP